MSLRPVPEFSTLKPLLTAETEDVVPGEHLLSVAVLVSPTGREAFFIGSVSPSPGEEDGHDIVEVLRRAQRSRGIAADGPGGSYVVTASQRVGGVPNRLEVFCADLGSSHSSVTSSELPRRSFEGPLYRCCQWKSLHPAIACPRTCCPQWRPRPPLGSLPAAVFTQVVVS